MFNSTPTMKGTVNLVLRGPDGRVKQHKTVRNKVMNLGLAHIIGRMIDPQQNGAARQAPADETDAAFGDVNTAKYQHDIPSMMRYMGIGSGRTPNISSLNTAGSGDLSTSTPTADERITIVSGEGTEYRLQFELTSGTGVASATGTTNSDYSMNYKSVTSTTNLARSTPYFDDGRADMANSRVKTLADLTAATSVGNVAGADVFGSLSAQLDQPAAGTDFNATGASRVMVEKDENANLFQGSSASGTITPSAAGSTSEGTTGITHATNSDTSASGQTANNITGFRTGDTGYANPNKRTGTKLVFIAVFPPYAPSNSNIPISISEAGIFNSADGRHTNGAQGATSNKQTMLCRTVFNPVNKYKLDSLQITWTIDFQDATS